MRFSKKSEYALRALIELTKAYGGTPVRRHQIAERQNIPIVFLEQILLALKHAGLLASARGAQGGYVLIKPPAKGTLGQVIRILDGPVAPIGCVSKTAYKKCRDCPYAKKTYCPLQDAMRSEEHTSELQSRLHLVCRLLLEKKKKKKKKIST